jgi:hypothetical protein
MGILAGPRNVHRPFTSVSLGSRRIPLLGLPSAPGLVTPRNEREQPGLPRAPRRCEVLLFVDSADRIDGVVERGGGGNPAVIGRVERGSQVGPGEALEDSDALGAFVGGLSGFVSRDPAE